MHKTKAKLVICFSLTLIVFLNGCQQNLINKNSQIALQSKSEEATEKEYLDKLRSLEKKSNYKEAVKVAQEFLDRFPNSKSAPKFQQKIASYYQWQKLYKKAIREYQTLIKKFPESKEADWASFRIVLCKKALYHINPVSDLREIIRTTDNKEVASYAQYIIAQFFLKSGLYPEAREEYNVMIANYPKSKFFCFALYDVAETYFLEGDYEQAKIEAKKVIETLKEKEDKFAKGDIIMAKNLLSIINDKDREKIRQAVIEMYKEDIQEEEEIKKQPRKKGNIPQTKQKDEVFTAQYEQIAISSEGKVIRKIKIWMKGQWMRKEEITQGERTIAIVKDNVHYLYYPKQRIAIKLPPVNEKNKIVVAVSSLIESVKNAKKIGSEVIDDKQCDIYYYENSEANVSNKIWLWREEKFPLRYVIKTSEGEITVKFKNIKLGISIPDNLFEFASGTEIADFSSLSDILKKIK